MLKGQVTGDHGALLAGRDVQIVGVDQGKLPGAAWPETSGGSRSTSSTCFPLVKSTVRTGYTGRAARR